LFAVVKSITFNLYVSATTCNCQLRLNNAIFMRT